MKRGKFRMMSAKRVAAGPNEAGGTSLGSRKPSGPARSDQRSGSACQRLNETVTASPLAGVSSSAKWRHGSARKPPFLSSNIKSLLERRQTDAAIGVGKLLAWAPQSEICVDQPVDRGGDLVRRHRRSDDAAQRRLGVVAAADRDLVRFGAVLFETEDADVADMVMAASVDAARNLDLQR